MVILYNGDQPQVCGWYTTLTLWIQIDGHIIQWGSASGVWLVYSTHLVDTVRWSYYTMGMSLRCVAGIQHSPCGYRHMPQETWKVLDVVVVMTEHWVQDVFSVSEAWWCIYVPICWVIISLCNDKPLPNPMHDCPGNTRLWNVNKKFALYIFPHICVIRVQDEKASLTSHLDISNNWQLDSLFNSLLRLTPKA